MSPAAFYRLRRVWLLLAGAQTLPILYLAYYLLFSGHGQSLSFKLLAVMVAGFAVSVIGFAIGLTDDRLAKLRALSGRWSGIFVIVGLVILALFGREFRPEWLYAFIALDLAVCFSAFYRTVYVDSAASQLSRRWIVLVALLVVVITAIRIRALAVYPSIHAVDEPWTLGWALSFARTGHLSDPMFFHRDFDIYRFYALLGTWLRIFGEDYQHARLFTFLLTLVCTGFSALAAQNLYGRRTAWMTAAVLFSSTIVVAGARIRHDIGLGIAVAVSLWITSEGFKRDKPWLHFLAGLMMGLGFLAHVHAALLGISMGIGLYGPAYIRRWRAGRRIPEAGVWFYAVGGLLAAVVVLLIQPLPSRTGEYLDRSDMMPDNVLAAALHHIGNIASYSQYEALLIALGLGAALWRHRKEDMVLVTLFATTHLALGFSSAGVFSYYLVPLVPLYGILVGALLGEGLDRLPAATKTLQAGTAVVSAFLLIPLLSFAVQVPLDGVIHNQPVQLPVPAPAQWVLDHVAPGETVAGEHYYYLWLLDYRYISPLVPSELPQDERSQYPTLSDLWNAVQVDVFIVDTDQSSYPLLKPLVDAKYFRKNGYSVAARFGNTTIYQRAE